MRSWPVCQDTISRHRQFQPDQRLRNWRRDDLALHDRIAILGLDDTAWVRIVENALTRVFMDEVAVRYHNGVRTLLLSADQMRRFVAVRGAESQIAVQVKLQEYEGAEMGIVEQDRSRARTAAPAVAVLLLLAAAAAEARSGISRDDAESFAMGACLTRQMPERLRDEGYLWTRAVMDRGGSLATWHALGNAVVAEAARRPVPMGRGDSPVADPLVPMPVLHCHQVVRSPAVRAAIARAVR